MAKQNLGKIIMTPKGVYNNSTTYEFLDVVTYEGSSYVCKQASTGNLPTTDYWQLLASKGDKPVVGVDYFTEEDKKEIADLVIEHSDEDIDELFNALPSDTASGTEINVTDSINCRCIETKVNGMSIQDGEPSPTTPVEIVSLGYENLAKNGTVSNLLDYANYIVSTSTGEAKLWWDNIIGLPRDVEIVGNWNFESDGVVINNISGVRVYIGYSDGTYLLAIKGQPFTIPSDKTISEIRVYGNQQVTYSKWDNIIFTKGATPHKYVPYGKNGVEVITSSKNLLSLDGFNTQTVDGITATKNKDGTITFNGTSTSPIFLNLNYIADYYIFISTGDVVSIGVNNVLPQGMYLCLRPIDTNDNSILIYNGESEKVNQTAKFTNNAFVFVYIPSGLKLDNFTIFPMVAKANTLTEYKQYQKSVSVMALNEPLRSLPNGVKDITYIKNNKLYVDRYVGSVVLNGSEEWGRYDTYNSINQLTTTITNLPKYYGTSLPNENTLICSHFNSIGYSSYWTKNNSVLFASQNKLFIQTELSVDDFKTWLSTHNTQVDYELATPVTEEYGYSDFKFIDGENNISNSSDTYMTLEFYTKMKGDSGLSVLEVQQMIDEALNKLKAELTSE